MTKAIWKYELTPGRTTLSVPKGERVLCVMTQYDDVHICIWMLVDPSAEKVERTFICIGTGHQVEDRQLGKYIGTVKLHDDEIIAHVFEEAQ